MNDTFSLFDDMHLGQTVDEVESNYSQTDLNNMLLIEHDRRAILESLKYKISRPNLEFLLNSIDLNDNLFYKNLLNEIASVYSLHIAKIYADGILSTKSISSETLKFLFYLKIKLINNIDKSIQLNDIIINRDITRDKFEEYLKLDNAPEIMNMCIKYMDKENYKRFINRINLESSMTYMD